ncbi:hypothetical protein ABG067_005592 [Albugo candida]
MAPAKKLDVISDNRFSKVHYDPVGSCDKHGRSIQENESQTNDMKKFYRIDDEERLDYLTQMARGEIDKDEESSSSESELESDAMDLANYEDEKQVEDIAMGEITKRFAIMNCDWTRLRAVDIFALCQSFAPATGSVSDVTIYPSDFGVQKMKEEARYGPRELTGESSSKQLESESENGIVESEPEKEIEEAESDNDEAVSDSETASDSESDQDEDDPLGVQQSAQSEELGGIDQEKLRQYELQKLRYYYAIVKCDSVKTAKIIADQCDQMEYETSSNVLDVRFVPNDMEFTNPPKESCQSIPDAYKPSLFATKVLQQTDVESTWEQDDPDRIEKLTSWSNWNELEDNDFSTYLASSNSEGSDVEDFKNDIKSKIAKKQYRQILLNSDTEQSDKECMRNEVSEDEKELTFHPDASDILKSKHARELESSTTPFEKHVREMKQKKNQKRHEKRAKHQELAREQRTIMRSSKTTDSESNVALLRSAVNEEVTDENAGDDRDFDMKRIAKQQKLDRLHGKAKKKALERLKKQPQCGLQRDFQFNAEDERFAALYREGTAFQLDPTESKFKRTAATEKILETRRERVNKQGSTESGAEKDVVEDVLSSLKRKAQHSAKHWAKKNKRSE